MTDTNFWSLSDLMKPRDTIVKCHAANKRSSLRTGIALVAIPGADSESLPMLRTLAMASAHPDLPSPSPSSPPPPPSSPSSSDSDSSPSAASSSPVETIPLQFENLQSLMNKNFRHYIKCYGYLWSCSENGVNKIRFCKTLQNFKMVPTDSTWISMNLVRGTLVESS